MPAEQSYRIEILDIASIHIPTTVRAVSEHLDMLTDSIRNVGLLHPITVRQVGESSYELLSGHNRLEAVKQLDWKTIPAHVLHYAASNQWNRWKQQLSIADENLYRDDLTDLEFAEALGRAKTLYERLYPETKHNARKKKEPQSDPTNGSEPTKRPAFVDHEATVLGRSRSSIGGYCSIYKKLKKEVRDRIRTHKVADSYKDLSSLARETTDQLALATILQDYPDYSVRDAKKHLAQQREQAEEPMAATTDEGIDEHADSHNASTGQENVIKQELDADFVGVEYCDVLTLDEEGQAAEEIAYKEYYAVIPASGEHPELRLPPVRSAHGAAYIYNRFMTAPNEPPVNNVKLNAKEKDQLLHEFIDSVGEYMKRSCIAQEG